LKDGKAVAEEEARSCGPGPGRFYEQLEAIIFTESTFSFGALAVELAVALVPDVVVLVLAAPPSTVPVISTL
jgi:hypothetical protein